MSDALLISVRFHEGWYHGSGDTPSPARMFQALVAGAGISGPLEQTTVESLTWLERQEPPIVGSPYAMSQRAYVNYMPNNEADAYDGYQERIKKAEKRIAALVFDPEIPFLFAWQLKDDSDVETSGELCNLADCVYQLGRTVDMAWAWGEVLPSDELQERLSSYPGIVRYPSSGTGDVDCPTPGSLESLRKRYAAAAERFSRTADGKGQTFKRRPKPKWKKVNYEGTASQLVLELHRSEDAGFASWPLERSSELVELVRDGAAEKLRNALKDRIPEIDRTLIGRKPNGENDGLTSARVRIIPLPSIGHEQADMQIRRVLIDVPSECPIRSDDIAWAVSGLQLVHPVSRELIDVTISDDRSQLRYFGIEQPSRIWRSVTPVALPDAARRRIDPERIKIDEKEKKGGVERYGEQIRVSNAVSQALRHAGIRAKVNSVRVQREPFDLRGIRVEPFANGTRFSKHSLWHLELEFDSPLSGPLLIGNGRFLGLGLMKPVQPTIGVFAFSIESGLSANPDPMRLSHALRRAVMARVRDALGTSRLPSYFSGHREDGAPSRSEVEPHLAFVFDPLEQQLLVVSPDHLDKRHCRRDHDNLATLESALRDFHELRAGPEGYLRLQRTSVDFTCHHLFALSHTWESITPYQVNRHAKRSTAETILKNDILVECERRGLPHPEITVLEWNAARHIGLRGNLRLKFRDAINGPVILGRTRHGGGGVFAAMNQ